MTFNNKATYALLGGLAGGIAGSINDRKALDVAKGVAKIRRNECYGLKLEERKNKFKRARFYPNEQIKKIVYTQEKSNLKVELSDGKSFIYYCTNQDEAKKKFINSLPSTEIFYDRVVDAYGFYLERRSPKELYLKIKENPKVDLTDFKETIISNERYINTFYKQIIDDNISEISKLSKSLKQLSNFFKSTILNLATVSNRKNKNGRIAYLVAISLIIIICIVTLQYIFTHSDWNSGIWAIIVFSLLGLIILFVGKSNCEKLIKKTTEILSSLNES